MPAIRVAVGQVYGMLTVLERRENSAHGATRWLVECECGVQKVVAAYNLHSGHTRACGCQKGSNHRHGHARKDRTGTYNSWHNMKQRCLNPNDSNYHYYGGRGISIAPEWVDSFEQFLADMGERPEGLTLDRIDPNGDYEPGNARWADLTTQRRNRRSTEED